MTSKVLVLVAAVAFNGCAAIVATGDDAGGVARQKEAEASTLAEVTRTGHIMRPRGSDTLLRDRHRIQTTPIVAVAQGTILDAKPGEAVGYHDVDVLMHTPSFADGWCHGKSETELCSRLWWCGWRSFVKSSALITSLWLLLFFMLQIVVYPCFKRRLQNWPSTAPEEEGGPFFAWLLQSTILAILVVAMSSGVLPYLVRASAPVQLARPDVEARQYYDDLLMVAWASHIFMCYIVSDLIASSAFRLISYDMVAHHIIFIMVSLIITFNCFGALLAGTLLLMEASTPFLNFFLYFRHRSGWGPQNKLVEMSFYLFAICFVVFRLILFPLVCGYFFYHLAKKDTPVNLEVLPASLGVIGLCLVLAIAVQFVWATQIGKKVLKFLSRGGEEDGVEDSQKVEKKKMLEPLLSASSAQPPVAG